MRCAIHASQDNLYPDPRFKILLGRLENKLRNEPSSTVWTRMLKFYCAHKTPIHEKRCEDTFIKALRWNWKMIRKLNRSRAFADLKADPTCAPMLVTLFLSFLSQIDWENIDFYFTAHLEKLACEE